MLEKKLEKARIENSQKQIKLLLILVAILLSCLTIYFLVATIKKDSSIKKNVAISEPDQTSSRLSEQEKDALREQFKTLLQQFETTLEANMPTGSNWKEEETFEVSQLKKSSIATFTDGEYQRAIEEINLATEKAQTIIEETRTAFNKSLGQARSSLAQDKYHESKLFIEQALLIKPLNPEAEAVAQEIEKLPHILNTVEQLETAQKENNLQKELELLLQLHQAAPDRDGVEERIQDLEHQIEQQALNHHISSGFAALDAGKAQLGKQHYLKARQIDPTRQELKILANRIAALERKNRIMAALNKAEQAIRRDDWQSGATYFQQVLKDAPQHTTASQGMQQATLITSLQEELKGYLQDPYRLSDPVIAKSTQDLLSRAKPAEQYSFSLQQQVKKLKKNLLLMNRPIQVTVLSDQKTHVRVRGVGNVGIVLKKNITLKPGRYTFEGTRTGFTSKLVQVLIPYNQTSFQVEVICNEPI